jgi:hypothetical protein
MPYYLIAIYSILIFPRFNTLIKAIKLKENILNEVLVTLLSILIIVCYYIYFRRRS